MDRSHQFPGKPRSHTVCVRCGATWWEAVMYDRGCGRDDPADPSGVVLQDVPQFPSVESVNLLNRLKASRKIEHIEEKPDTPTKRRVIWDK